MMTRLCVVILLIWGLPAAFTGLAAEWPAAKAKKPPQPQNITVNGTITSVSGERIHVAARRTSRPWVVVLQSGTRVTVIGTAEPGYLAPGMVLQFKAEMDEQGNPPAKVGEMTVVTASSQNPLGCFRLPADGSPPAANSAVGAGTGVKHARPKPPAKPDDDLGSLIAPEYKINGKITSIDGSRLSLRAGKRTISIELAESPTIHVLLSDASRLLPGSRIEAIGQGSRKAARCQADQVEVTLAKPLSGKKTASPTPSPSE
jgi:hypothetical protein